MNFFWFRLTIEHLLSVAVRIYWRSCAFISYFIALLILLNYEMPLFIHLEIYLLFKYSMLLLYFWLILTIIMLYSTNIFGSIFLCTFCFAIVISFLSFLTFFSYV